MSIADKLAFIAMNERKVYKAGFEKGEQSREQAIEEGIQTEKDNFWFEYQKYYLSENCNYRFAGKGWNIYSFNPQYDIIPTIANGMFREFGNNVMPFSLTERLADCNVVLDTSNCTSLDCAFYDTPFTDIPHIDTKKVTNLNQLFRNSIRLKSVSIALDEDGDQTWNSVFDGCTALKDLTITSGSIGKSGFSIKDSTKITLDSLSSILNACNTDATDNPISVTFPINCIDGATDTRALLMEAGGTVEYVEDSNGINGAQLRHQNIKPGSLVLTPQNDAGEQTDAEYIDDGNGNIIHPYIQEDYSVIGRIDYVTGTIEYFDALGTLRPFTKYKYFVETPYSKALLNGYDITFE
ncbi:MAG: hypothetical protein IKV36_02185 [Clostridia bacterium]|nr:hypothetical protein [Clostridia bacterium]